MDFAPSAQAVNLPSSLEAAEAMTTAPAAKKVRVEEPKPFRALDVDAMTVKVVDGREEQYYLPLLDNESIRFLLTPEEPSTIIWGFDMEGVVEQRSFNSSMQPKKSGSENLSIRIDIGKEQADFLEKLDEKMQALFGADATWVPMVSKNDKFEKPTTKLNVCLRGDDANLTLLKVKRGDGPVEKGHGWDFLKTVAIDTRGRQNAFTGAEVKVVAKLRAWKMTGKSDNVVRAGIAMAATQLFIKPKPREVVEEADILEDW